MTAGQSFNNLIHHVEYSEKNSLAINYIRPLKNVGLEETEKKFPISSLSLLFFSVSFVFLCLFCFSLSLLFLSHKYFLNQYSIKLDKNDLVKKWEEEEEMSNALISHVVLKLVRVGSIFCMHFSRVVFLNKSNFNFSAM